MEDSINGQLYENNKLFLLNDIYDKNLCKK
jgi:hypothetical protein